MRLNHALSFTEQPRLRELFEVVATPAEGARPVTVICGAGVSVDAGLPTWNSLIRNMCQAADPVLAPMLLADQLDAPRKAEYAVRLADGRKRMHEVVRDALYPHGLSPQPNLIADGVARLLAAAPSRVRLATTNFDNVLELALASYLGEESVHSRGLSDADAWFEETANGNTAQILHLHGMVLPGEHEPLLPLILTESLFLRHGPAVQAVVKRLLVDTQVILVGVSLSDPNLIGPLTELLEEEVPYAAPYLLAVPDAIPGFEANDSLNYLVKRAEYFEQTLNVRTVFLKAYQQISQLLYDLTLAMEDPPRYFSDDPESSLRYGYRLRRKVADLYAAVGSESLGVAPSGSAAAGLSDALYTELQGPFGPAQLLQEFLEQLSDEELQRHGLSRTYVADERWALFLWLRAAQERPLGPAPLALRLLGTSAYVHRDAWSYQRETGINSDATEPHARAAFTGTAQLTNLTDERANPLWRAAYALPVNVVPTNEFDVLTVGVITLQTTRSISTAHALREACQAGQDVQGRLRPSLLSLADQAFDEELRARLVEAALVAFGEGNLLSRT